jgi:hypothetical protein
MLIRIWLSKSSTEVLSLRMLHVIGALMCVWVAVSTVLAVTEHRLLAAENSTLKRIRDQYATDISTIPLERNETRSEIGLRLTSPTGAGGSEFAGEISGLCVAENVSLKALQLGTGGSSSSSSSPSATSATASLPAGNAWEHQPFECRLVGHYGGLAKYLDGLSSSHRVFEYGTIQIVHADSDALQAGNPSLQLTVSGVLTGLANTK